MPQISVVVPVYKVELYLRRCVDSILCQTYPDFELILVDDGSPDQCGKICDEYSRIDRRVHVIHRKNGGLSAARNTGIDWAFMNSDSKWISFVDSDDWVHPMYLEALYNAVTHENVYVSICGSIKTSGAPLPDVDSVTESIWALERVYSERTINETVAWGKLYKKECFKDIRYPEGKLHEDEFVTYKILFQYQNVAVVDQPLYAYFQNEDGIMHQSWNLRRMAAFDALEEQVDFFLKHNNRVLAERRFRLMTRSFIKHSKMISDSLQLSQEEREGYHNIINKRFRYILFKYRKYKWLSVRKHRSDLWIYANAYPCIMRLLNCWQRIKPTLYSVPFFGRIIQKIRGK